MNYILINLDKINLDNCVSKVLDILKSSYRPKMCNIQNDPDHEKTNVSQTYFVSLLCAKHALWSL